MVTRLYQEIERSFLVAGGPFHPESEAKAKIAMLALLQSQWMHFRMGDA